MSFDQQAPLAGLASKVHEILSSSDHRNMVAVLGWRSNWHDEVTRRLANEKKVTFIDDLRHTSLGWRIAFALYTHRVGHSEMSRVKSRIPIAPVCLRPHQIHELFRMWYEVQQLRM